MLRGRDEFLGWANSTQPRRGRQTLVTNTSSSLGAGLYPAYFRVYTCTPKVCKIICFRLFIVVLGHYFTYFGGPGM